MTLNPALHPLVDYINQSAPPSTTVNVTRIEQPVIWVTLPGDNASHKLTEAQAKELLRKLEEVV